MSAPAWWMSKATTARLAEEAAAAAALAAQSGIPLDAQLARETAAEAQKAASKPQPFKSESLDEFLARAFPPIVWLVQDLVASGTTGAMFSAPNVGKTFLATYFAFDMAARGFRVLTIQMEGAGAKYQKRLKRAREAAGPITGEVRVIFRPAGFSLLNPADLAWLIEESRGFDLVLLDSLSAMVNADENEVMRDIGEAITRVRDETNAAVWALHHMTKEAWRRGQIPTLASLRGPGVLAGRIDAALALVPPTTDDVAGLVRFNLWTLKQRDDQKADPLAVEVLMTGDAAVVTMEPLDVKKAVNAAGDLHADVLARLSYPGPDAKPWSKSRLARELKKSEGAVGDCVEELIVAKQITRPANSWELFRTPPPPPPLGGP